MTDMHLAQLNVARPRAPMDDPQMADFKAALEPVNLLADEAQGFVWRLTDGFGGDATTIRLAGGEIMVNLSVWDSRDALWNFAYRSPHMDYLRRRREWFHQLAEPYQVLWWVPAGHRPTVAEAEDRLKAVRSEGPGPAAFTFRHFYPLGALTV
jgi:Domain of unknown function (DUF3291)